MLCSCLGHLQESTIEQQKQQRNSSGSYKAAPTARVPNPGQASTHIIDICVAQYRCRGAAWLKQADKQKEQQLRQLLQQQELLLDLIACSPSVDACTADAAITARSIGNSQGRRIIVCSCVGTGEVSCCCS